MAREKRERSWWACTRDTAEEVDIDIYDDIGETEDWWTGETYGIGAKTLLDKLRECRGKAVNLHINSGGGSVVDACAMMTALAAHDGKVTAYVDGLAASAASFLLAGADEVVMSSVAWIMIHDATARCWGGAQDMRDVADYLDKTNRAIAEIYAKRSETKDVDDFMAAMAETTWFTADEAVEWGLADTVMEAVAAAACFTADEAALASAPPAARASGIVRRAPGDTSGNMTATPRDAGGTDGQEPSGARERGAWIGGSYMKIKKKGNEDA